MLREGKICSNHAIDSTYQGTDIYTQCYLTSRLPNFGRPRFSGIVFAFTSLPLADSFSTSS
jgi:hypothetical protein